MFMSIECVKELKDKYIEYRDTLNLSKKITFGVEIEYENVLNSLVTHELKKLNITNWTNKTEVDIREYTDCFKEMNGEIVSPILIDSKETWKNLKKILEMLNGKNAIITNKCGGHVNIGIQIFENNLEYYKKFLYAWMFYSIYIRRFSTGDFDKLRNFKDTHFNPVIFNPESNMTGSVYGFNPCLFDKHHEIYIHVQNGIESIYDDRIEFRIPNGTLDPSIFQNYINFFAKFIIACKNIDREEIIYKIKKNKNSLNDLLDFTFDNELDKENFKIQYYKINEYYRKKHNNHIFRYKDN